jgi:hypothetical protein
LEAERWATPTSSKLVGWGSGPIRRVEAPAVDAVQEEPFVFVSLSLVYLVELTPEREARQPPSADVAVRLPNPIVAKH